MDAAPPKIGTVERIFIYTCTGIADLVKFGLGFIPGINLLGWLIWATGSFMFFLYGLIRIGTQGFLGGAGANKKIGTFLITTMIGAVPALDTFVPELTIQAFYTFRYLDQEEKEYLAKELAQTQSKLRRPQAANDNLDSQEELSQAA